MKFADATTTSKIMETQSTLRRTRGKGVEATPHKRNFWKGDLLQGAETFSGCSFIFRRNFNRSMAFVNFGVAMATTDKCNYHDFQQVRRLLEGIDH